MTSSEPTFEPIASRALFDAQSGNRLERLIFNHRALILGLFALISLVLGWKSTQLTVNANFERMTFNSGAGDYTLSFDGDLQRDASVTIDTGAATVNIILPEGANAQVTFDGGLTTVNLDFTRLYRPQTNVVSRPVAGIGKGYSLVGHHELMIPLLAAALVDTL